ncbi:STAS domain-containing protein [Bacillus timonensis]|nr:STAS domain-containing protein [Bacillus timonensis]
MDTFILQFIDSNKEDIIKQWLDEFKQLGKDRGIHTYSEQMYLGTSREFINIILLNVKKDRDDFSQKLKEFAESVIQAGWQLTYITEGLQLFRKVVIDSALEGHVQAGDHLKIMREINDWIDPIINEMISLYSGSWEHTVSLQKIALEELSAPLIPVFENITVMPLVGTIDTERAKQIMENLLQGVVKHRSEVVLIDITGVPVVDTMVAHHIIQAAEAVKLVGTECLLVGIRPEIAQTIVNLGIQLNQFITKSTLRKGIETALQMTNRKIVQTNVED